MGVEYFQQLSTNFRRILNGFGSERHICESSRQSPFQSYRNSKNYFLSISTCVQLSIAHLIFIYIRIMITNRSMASVDEPQPAGLALATLWLLSARVLRDHPIRWIDLCCLAGGIRLRRGCYVYRLRWNRIRASLRACGGLVFFICCSLLSAT